jgi:hypothetical protein
LQANSPSEGWTGVLQRMARDKELCENGYIPFGKGTDIDYDPACFAMSSRKNRDYRVVDQEEILCNYRVKVVSELPPSFRALVSQTIEE